ncbi:MAG TPA: histidine kinase [Pyrinomonadaceae bacterium]
MPKRIWFMGGVVFAGWMLIGLSFSLNDYLFKNMLHEYYSSTISLRSMMSWDLAYWPTWVVLMPLIYWIARRFPLGRDIRTKNLLVNVLAGIPLSILHRFIYLIITLLFGEPVPLKEVYLFLFYNLPMGFMSYALIMLASHLYNDYRATRLEAELTRARLKALQMQLGPHFLSNALNSISNQLHEDPATANEMLVKLSRLLRLTAEQSSAPVITLREELDFMSRYLDIEQLRYKDRLQVRYEVDEPPLGAQVPSLILQPLIENAITHGVGGSFGSVQIVISARRKRGRLSLKVSDNGEGTPADGDTYVEGLGLTNTRERLKTAYGSSGHFELRRTPGGWTEAVLELPFVTTAGNVEAATVRG